MKKTKLKPYVHKVKGARNYALYDLLKGNFYTITPEGDVEQLKMALKEAGLTFETDGAVPFKVNIGRFPLPVPYFSPSAINEAGPWLFLSDCRNHFFDCPLRLHLWDEGQPNFFPILSSKS